MSDVIKLHLTPLYLCLMREYYSEFGITHYSMSLIQGELDIQTDELLESDGKFKIIKPLTA